MEQGAILDDAIRWLGELVAFDTISAHSNKPLIDYIERELRTQCGIEGVQLPTADGKSSYFATIGPRVDGGIVLSGHTDVVPVDGQDWATNPFEIVQKDGRIYGRGTCDMKGFIACVLALVPIFQKAPLKKPLHLAFSRDEEVGCAGADDILQLVADSGLKPSMALVGEPSNMQTIWGHKGGYTMKTTFRGTPAHSSLPATGVSTIPYAARFITYLEQLEKDLAEKSPLSIKNLTRHTPPSMSAR